MKDDSVLRHLRETAWRRPLTPAENADVQRLLASDPEAAAEWHLETQLSRAVAILPDAPVASNFTSRVLEAIERETTTDGRPRKAWWSLHGWLPRLAFACVVMGVCVVGVRQYDRVSDERMANSVAVISPVGALPTPEALADFETIRHLGSEPAADVELLSLLQ